MSKKDIFNNWFKQHDIEDVEVLLPDMAGAGRGEKNCPPNVGGCGLRIAVANFCAPTSGYPSSEAGQRRAGERMR